MLYDHFWLSDNLVGAPKRLIQPYMVPSCAPKKGTLLPINIATCVLSLILQDKAEQVQAGVEGGGAL